MPSFTTTPFPEAALARPRVCVERRIFVGDDREAFLKDWVAPLDADYQHGRIEGYVLDLTGGELWAALDLSDVSDAAHQDIALRSVQPDDARAREVFLSLTQNCDPVTAVNILTRAFDRGKWPLLAAVCDAFTRRYTSLSSATIIPELEQERFESQSISWELIPPDGLPLPMKPHSSGQNQHVYHCVLGNGSEESHAQRRNGEATRLGDKILEVRLNGETAELVENSTGSRLPDQLDRNDTIFLLTSIEMLLEYRHKRHSVQKIQNLRRKLFSLSNLAVTGR